MNALPLSVQKVIDEFAKLPGVGPKSASRMAYYYLRGDRQDGLSLARALLEMEKNVVLCQKCYNVSETEICPICDAPALIVDSNDKKVGLYGKKGSARDHKKLCVVEESLDIVAIESAAIYDGLYFVLGGVISPADGISGDELRFVQLKKRIEELEADGLEIIVAVNPSVEGEATYDYIIRMLEKNAVKITKLAIGLPTGADLEYADKFTLSNAFDARK